MMKKFKKLLSFAAVVALLLSSIMGNGLKAVFAVTNEPESETPVYTSEDYDAVSNLDFAETSFTGSSKIKVTKGKDRYGVYFDVAISLRVESGLGIVQFPLPIDVRNSSFTYEILDPQTTYWVLVGVSSRKINQQVETGGAYWSLSQEADHIDTSILANRGTLGMYFEDEDLRWQKTKYYTRSGDKILSNSPFEIGQQETVTLSEGADNALTVQVSGTSAPVDTLVTDYTDYKGYIHFEACSSAADQVSKMRLRLNVTDLGEGFTEQDLTDYILGDINEEDFEDSILDTHADIKVKKGSDAIGDYYDIKMKITSDESVATVQFPAPVALIDEVKGNLGFSWKPLDSNMPYWFGVGVSSADAISFKDFTGTDGSPSAYGMYFQDTLARYQYLWHHKHNSWNSNNLEEDKTATGISYSTENYVHYAMEESEEKLGVKINGTKMEGDYTNTFSFNKGYITFMACAKTAGETAFFRLRVGTAQNTDYTVEDEATDFDVHVTGITVKSGNTVIENNAAIELTAGESKTYTVLVSPADATYSSVVWNSSNSSILAVKNNGVVTAKNAGTVVVTVTVGIIVQTFNFTVKAAPSIEEPTNNLWMVIVIGMVVMAGAGTAIFFVLKKSKA